MENVLNIIFFIVSAVLVISTLLQGSNTNGASGAIMGGGMNVFSNAKERSTVERVVNRITMISGILFMTIAVLIKII